MPMNDDKEVNTKTVNDASDDDNVIVKGSKDFQDKVLINGWQLAADNETYLWQDNDVMLTTFDNVFNPYENFDEWWNEDRRLGHKTNELLASFSNYKLNMTEVENAVDTEKAINQIVFSGLFPEYCKIYRPKSYNSDIVAPLEGV